MAALKVFYPQISHSGCIFCPVLILFYKRIKDENPIRIKNTIDFTKKVFKEANIIPNKELIECCPELEYNYKKLKKF
jgi:hypothetical protein